MKKHLLLAIALLYESTILVLNSKTLIAESFSYQIPFVCLCGLYAYNMYLAHKQLPDIRKEVEEAFQQRDQYMQDLKNDLSKVSMSVSRSGVINEKIRF